MSSKSGALVFDPECINRLQNIWRDIHIELSSGIVNSANIVELLNKSIPKTKAELTLKAFVTMLSDLANGDRFKVKNALFSLEHPYLALLADCVILAFSLGVCGTYFITFNDGKYKFEYGNSRRISAKSYRRDDSRVSVKLSTNKELKEIYKEIQDESASSMSSSTDETSKDVRKTAQKLSSHTKTGAKSSREKNRKVETSSGSQTVESTGSHVVVSTDSPTDSPTDAPTDAPRDEQGEQ